jgi:hypothetical protein
MVNMFKLYGSPKGPFSVRFTVVSDFISTIVISRESKAIP